MPVFEAVATLATKIVSASTLAQATAGLGIAVAGVTGAGAAGVLPGPVQDVVAGAVESVTLLDLPSGEDRLTGVGGSPSHDAVDVPETDDSGMDGPGDVPGIDDDRPDTGEDGPAHDADPTQHTDPTHAADPTHRAGDDSRSPERIARRVAEDAVKAAEEAAKDAAEALEEAREAAERSGSSGSGHDSGDDH